MAYEVTRNGKSIIRIDSVALMKRYFDYPDLRDRICDADRRDAVLDILGRGPYDPKQILPILQLGTNMAHGEDDNEIFGGLVDVNQDDYQVNMEKAKKFILNLGNKAQEGDENWDQGIIGTIEEVFRGAAPLKREQAYELLLFCGLFAFLHEKPKDKDVQYLCKYLGLVPLLQKNMELFTSSTELECYQYVPGRKLELQLTVLHNQTNEPAWVKVNGSSLCRHLAVNERALALTAHQGVVAFLPRTCVVKGLGVHQEGNRLKIGNREVHLSSEQVYFFSWSNSYGYLKVDENGHLDQNEQIEQIKPKINLPTSIVWAKCDFESCGFLGTDGVYTGFPPISAWKDRKLIAFDLSGASGVALTEDRTAINQEGKELGKNVAAVSCFGKRYILLMLDGSVVTDQGKQAGIAGARAVCADRDGYWIAEGQRLLYERNGTQLTYQVQVEEMVRDNDGWTVYGVTNDGRFLNLGKLREKGDLR